MLEQRKEQEREVKGEIDTAYYKNDIINLHVNIRVLIRLYQDLWYTCICIGLACVQLYTIYMYSVE